MEEGVCESSTDQLCAVDLSTLVYQGNGKMRPTLEVNMKVNLVYRGEGTLDSELQKAPVVIEY